MSEYRELFAELTGDLNGSSTLFLILVRSRLAKEKTFASSSHGTIRTYVSRRLYCVFFCFVNQFRVVFWQRKDVFLLEYYLLFTNSKDEGWGGRKTIESAEDFQMKIKLRSNLNCFLWGVRYRGREVDGMRLEGKLGKWEINFCWMR